MPRRKSNKTIPLPPRDGLGASRVRLPEGANFTALSFLSNVIAQQRHRHPHDGEQAVLERFTAGEVVLRDGTVLSPDSIITPGTDIFFYRRPAPEQHVPYEIDIIYEDDNLLVVNKPPFLATMPRAAHILESATVRMRRATGNEEITPAHRLDRMTSGLLLMTKHTAVRGAYQSLFAERKVHKLYEAIGEDKGLNAPATWQHHIDKQHGEIAARLVPHLAANSTTHLIDVTPLPTSTLHQLHGIDAPLARYILEPVTGRTHQLRVQMNANGVPILGDPVYPVTRPFGDEDFNVPMRLASVALSFEDPLSGQHRTFTAPGHSGLAILRG